MINPPTPFTCQYRVYYEDTDAAGVVYYANYLKYAERARTEWLRSFDINQDTLLRERGCGFVVSRAEISYKRPARLDDIIIVQTHLQQIRKVRMSMRQILSVANMPCAELLVEIACVDSNFSPTPLVNALGETLLTSLNSLVTQEAL